MPAQLIKDLESSLSTPRLSRYRPNDASPANVDLETLVNYFWNLALAEALYCSLGAVEVALRNTIHTSLSAHFGTPIWYDQTGMLDEYQRREVGDAKVRIAKANPVTPDRVVGALTFAFWVTILSSPYDARLWRAASGSTLRAAFPYVRKSDRPRFKIHRRYNEIRELRNRVSHHEPLFDDTRLQRRHQDILWGIHWINPKLRQVVERLDRFPDVYANGRARVEAELKAHLDMP